MVAAIAVVLAAIGSVGSVSAARASTNQIAIIQDDPHVLADPANTLFRFRLLGAQMVRVTVSWASIAPSWQSTTRPEGFDATDPADYPAGAWDRWDQVARVAAQDGIALDFVLTGGSPRWADGSGIPAAAKTNPARAWFPSAKEFGEFAQAAGRRYDGTYPDPQNPGQTLPRVSFWSIWNEPNFGEDLAPQATHGSSVSAAPGMYRSLVAAAWSALQRTGHGHDKILIGSLAARGQSGRVTRSHPQGLPGNFGQTKPLAFIRNLYCVDSRLRPLRGRAASTVGCPTTTAASRRFRGQSPGLFGASGFGDHPYPGDQPPTRDRSRDPDFATFPQLPRLESELDRIQRTYGSRTRFPIYNDEYGYITKPPNRGRYVSPATAAGYLNWAEYLSWRSPRIVSTMQYLLYDPQPTQSGFSDGLLTSSGAFKPAYFAYRMPLFLPVTRAKPGRALEVWGCVRPAPYAAADTGQPQSAQIQFQRGSRGAFTTIDTAKITSSRGYFDVRIRFPASGTVRVIWSYPTGDPLLPQGGTVYSRHVQVTMR